MLNSIFVFDALILYVKNNFPQLSKVHTYVPVVLKDTGQVVWSPCVFQLVYNYYECFGFVTTETLFYLKGGSKGHSIRATLVGNLFDAILFKTLLLDTFL